MNRLRPARTGLLAVADGSLLVVLWPDLPGLARSLASPRQWLATDGVDHALAALAAAGLWCAAAWVAVGLLAASLGHLPGAAGAAATSIARRTLPTVLRRVVVGSAGLGVLLTPIAPLPAGAQPPDVPGGRPGVTAAPLPGPSWPGSGADHRQPATPPLPPGPSWPGSAGPEHLPSVSKTPSHTPSQTPTRTPPARTPTVPAPRPHTTPHTPPHTPPHTTPDPAPKPTSREPAPTPPRAERATVHAGDCLWLLAAQRVGPHATDADIAAYVPTLYAANRDVIGDDPDLVLPGQVLSLPAPHPVTDPQESS